LTYYYIQNIGSRYEKKHKKYEYFEKKIFSERKFGYRNGMGTPKSITELSKRKIDNFESGDYTICTLNDIASSRPHTNNNIVNIDFKYIHFY